jgi:hypothetical protein
MELDFHLIARKNGIKGRVFQIAYGQREETRRILHRLNVHPNELIVGYICPELALPQLAIVIFINHLAVELIRLGMGGQRASHKG